jgi:hypothetical protein
MTWQAVEAALQNADSIAFDGCHKIYILLDRDQTQQMRDYGYEEDSSELHEVTDPATALKTLREWWDDSCGLRFINSVRTVQGNPNDGFETLIAQFEEDS